MSPLVAPCCNMKRGNEDASDGGNEEQVSAEQDGSNDEQNAKNNAQAEDSSDSSTKSSVKRMRSEEQEVRLLIPSKVSKRCIKSIDRRNGLSLSKVLLFKLIPFFLPFYSPFPIPINRLDGIFL
uniref:Uncharacterized protein n=1 Tax=Anopheles maculatus TaxID=74869 RepID=A0A182T3K1_9DIPT